MEFDMEFDRGTGRERKDSPGGVVIATVVGVCFIAVLVMLTVKLGLVLFT